MTTTQQFPVEMAAAFQQLAPKARALAIIDFYGEAHIGAATAPANGKGQSLGYVHHSVAKSLVTAGVCEYVDHKSVPGTWAGVTNIRRIG